MLPMVHVPTTTKEDIILFVIKKYKSYGQYLERQFVDQRRWYEPNHQIQLLKFMKGRIHLPHTTARRQLPGLIRKPHQQGKRKAQTK